MTICFSRSDKGYASGEVLREPYSDFIKSRPLPPLASSTLQHAKRNTVRDKSKPSVPRSIAL